MGRETVKCKIMVIVHGKFEYVLCRHIKSALKIKTEIVSEDKGRHSIQITSVMNKLNERELGTISSFKRKYRDVEIKKGKLVNFKLFIIMDLDDCTNDQQNDL